VQQPVQPAIVVTPSQPTQVGPPGSAEPAAAATAGKLAPIGRTPAKLPKMMPLSPLADHTSKIKTLETKANDPTLGVVARSKAAQELAALNATDLTPMRKAKLTELAALRSGSKPAGASSPPPAQPKELAGSDSNEGSAAP